MCNGPRRCKLTSWPGRVELLTSTRDEAVRYGNEAEEAWSVQEIRRIAQRLKQRRISHASDSADAGGNGHLADGASRLCLEAATAVAGWRPPDRGTGEEGGQRFGRGRTVESASVIA